MKASLHEKMLRNAERGVKLNLAGQQLTLKAHVYSDAKPLSSKSELKCARHMVEVSKKAFGEQETRIAFGDDPISGAKRFFHGDLLHYLFFLETPTGRPVAYAQVAISEPNQSAYYTSAAISPTAQGKGTYDLLNVLRAAACARHLGSSPKFQVATRTENPKVIMHYSGRGWFPKLANGKVVFNKLHRRGLKESRSAFLLGRLGASPEPESMHRIDAHANKLYLEGPAEAGTYSAELANVQPDERAAALLDQIRVMEKGRRRKFNAAKGDSLYMVTSPANLKKWLASQKSFLKSVFGI